MYCYTPSSYHLLFYIDKHGQYFPFFLHLKTNHKKIVGMIVVQLKPFDQISQELFTYCNIPREYPSTPGRSISKIRGDISNFIKEPQFKFTLDVFHDTERLSNARKLNDVFNLDQPIVLYIRFSSVYHPLFYPISIEFDSDVHSKVEYMLAYKSRTMRDVYVFVRELVHVQAHQAIFIFIQKDSEYYIANMMDTIDRIHYVHSKSNIDVLKLRVKFEDTFG